MSLLYDWQLKYLAQPQIDDVASATIDVDVIAEEPIVEEPQTILEKLQHNRALYESGKISCDEMNLRNAALLSAEFPDLYK